MIRNWPLETFRGDPGAQPPVPGPYCAYMHRTGRGTLQPSLTVLVGSTVVGRMMMLALALREVAGPSVGARVAMKAVHTDGLSFLVRLVSYHTWAKEPERKVDILSLTVSRHLRA